MANMIVSGAGTAAVNGTYYWVEDYGLYSKNPSDVFNAPFIELFMGEWWTIDDETGILYEDANYDSSLASPDLVEEWVELGGEYPPPTVTAEDDEPEPPAKKYRYKPVSQLTGSIRQLGM